MSHTDSASLINTIIIKIILHTYLSTDVRQMLTVGKALGYHRGTGLQPARLFLFLLHFVYLFDNLIVCMLHFEEDMEGEYDTADESYSTSYQSSVDE